MRYSVVAALAALVLLCAHQPASATPYLSAWELRGQVTLVIVDPDTNETYGVCIDIGYHTLGDVCFSVSEAPPFWACDPAVSGSCTWRYLRDFVQQGDCVFARGSFRPQNDSTALQGHRADQVFVKEHSALCAP